MSDDPSRENLAASPPPVEGELLPRAAEALGLHYELETYSLNPTHKHGGPKARGFEQILGITIDAIDYLEAQILAVSSTPRSAKSETTRPMASTASSSCQSGGSARRPTTSSTSGRSGRSTSQAPRRDL